MPQERASEWSQALQLLDDMQRSLGCCHVVGYSNPRGSEWTRHFPRQVRAAPGHHQRQCSAGRLQRKVAAGIADLHLTAQSAAASDARLTSWRHQSRARASPVKWG